MPIAASLVAEGLHHAHTTGTIDIGAGNGQVPGLGAAQLLKLPLPFKREVYDKVGFEEQFYILSKSLDGNVTDIALDPIQFEADPVTGAPILRLNVSITAAPAAVEIWLESHHSSGR